MFVRWIVALSFVACLSLSLVAVEVPPDDVPLVYDLDGDGKMTVDDIVMFQAFLNINGDEYYNAEWDWNPDGELDWLDITSWLGKGGFPVGDFNLDGEVDNLDVGIMSTYYERPIPPWRDYTCGELTCDGKVDTDDLLAVLSQNPDFIPQNE